MGLSERCLCVCVECGVSEAAVSSERNVYFTLGWSWKVGFSTNWNAKTSFPLFILIVLECNSVPYLDGGTALRRFRFSVSIDQHTWRPLETHACGGFQCLRYNIMDTASNKSIDKMDMRNISRFAHECRKPDLNDEPQPEKMWTREQSVSFSMRIKRTVKCNNSWNYCEENLLRTCSGIMVEILTIFCLGFVWTEKVCHRSSEISHDGWNSHNRQCEHCYVSSHFDNITVSGWRNVKGVAHKLHTFCSDSASAHRNSVAISSRSFTMQLNK